MVYNYYFLGIAEDVSAGRVVSVLEGGCDLESLAACVRVDVKALMGA